MITLLLSRITALPLSSSLGELEDRSQFQLKYLARRSTK
jgi:hypothetical protein